MKGRPGGARRHVTLFHSPCSALPGNPKPPGGGGHGIWRTVVAAPCHTFLLVVPCDIERAVPLPLGCSTASHVVFALQCGLPPRLYVLLCGVWVYGCMGVYGIYFYIYIRKSHMVFL